MLKFFVVLWSVVGLASCASVSSTSPTFPTFAYEGHRGARGLWPENTTAAMIGALEFPKVNALEMDCHITKDKKVVVYHDPFLNPLFTTYASGDTLPTDPLQRKWIYHYTFAALDSFSIGQIGHPTFPKQQRVAAKIETLSSILENIETHGKKNQRAPIFYNIEIKSKPALDDRAHPSPAEFTDLVVAEIRANEVEDRTVIQSFDPRCIQYLHQRYPNLKTALLIEASCKESIDALIEKLGFTPFSISPHYSLVTPAFMQAAKNKGLKLFHGP